MAASIFSEASSVAGDLEGTAAAIVNLELDLGFGERREGEGADGAGRVRGRAGSSLTSRGVGGAAAWQHGMAPVCHGGTVRREEGERG